MIPDGTEGKVLLHSAARQRWLELVLHTNIRKDTETIHGAEVIFATSPTLKPTRGFWIEKSLTGRALGLAELTQPVAAPPSPHCNHHQNTKLIVTMLHNSTPIPAGDLCCVSCPLVPLFSFTFTVCLFTLNFFDKGENFPQERWNTAAWQRFSSLSEEWADSEPVRIAWSGGGRYGAQASWCNTLTRTEQFSTTHPRTRGRN